MQKAKTAMVAALLLACTPAFVTDAHAARWKDNPQPVYLSFKADRDSVAPGESFTLSWAASADVRCRAYGGWEGRKAASGTFQITGLSAPTEFGLTCGHRHNEADETVFVDVMQAEPAGPPPNDSELSASDDTQPFVSTPVLNQPPTVNAGADQSVTLPEGITLSGQVQDDGMPGTGTSVRWSVASGPEMVLFGNSIASSTTATFSAGGTYVLRLSANDGELSSYDDLTVQVSVAPTAPPTVSLTVDQSEIDMGESVRLDWTTTNADQCEASGDWSGIQPTEGSFFASPGQYATFTLSCQGGTETVTSMVSVLVRNLDLNWQAPVENVDGSPLTDLAGYRVYVMEGSQYELAEDITSPTTTSTKLAMPSGQYEIAMTAYDMEGNESAYSNAVTKTSP